MGFPAEYIGFEGTKLDDGSIKLGQRGYVKELAKSYGMEIERGNAAPILPGHVHGIFMESDDSDRCDTLTYQKAIGALLWITKLTRPDIMFAVSFLGRFSAKSTESEWKMIRHLL
eukprot:Ihof_evm5s492 gene=Ihof_evmTU5s492